MAEQVNIKVNIPEHMRTALSANIVRVTSTMNGEVLLDFVFSHPQDIINGEKQGSVVARISLPMKVARDMNMILSSQLGKAKSE